MLKKLMMGAALATMLATPALASQSYDPNFGSGNIEMVNPAPLQVAPRAAQAYAYVPATSTLTRSDNVYRNGHVIGRDPDANVRLQMERSQMQ